MVLTLSVMIVFITTYMLILPAITLVFDKAEEMGGIDVPAVEESTDAASDDHEEHLDDNSEERTEDQAGANIKDNNLLYEGDKYSIAVTDKKNILPSDTQVEVKEISAEKKSQAKQYEQLYQDALEAVRDDSGNKDIEDLKYARFYDITLTAGGSDVRLSDAVDVTISYEKALQKELKVADPDKVRIIHFAEDKKTGEVTPEILDSKKVDLKIDDTRLTDTTFEAEGFSIYAVVGEGDTSEKARMTLEFWNGDNKIATMTVKNDDTPEELETIIYDPGVGTLNPGELFKGWTFEKDYTLEDAKNAMNIKEIRQWAADKTIAEGETVKLYAALVKNYTVTYLDERESSLGTDNVSLLASDTTSPYTVQMGYTPVDDVHNFEGWNVKEGSSNIEGYTQGRTYENGDGITISGNVVFSVNAPEGHWLVFDENGKGATYNAPVFVKSGETTSKPCPDSSMQRTGYTFGGWYTASACTQPFTFGGEITDKTVLYAKWTPVSTAPYTVIIWKQNVSGEGYDFAEAIHLIGSVGENVSSITQRGSGNGAYARIEGRPEGRDVTYTGFHLDSFDQNVTVTPEGNTVVNVYYDRNEHTFTFQDVGGYEESTSTSSGNYYIPDGEGGYKQIYLTRSGDHWTYSETVTEYTPTTSNSGTQYGLVDGEYVQLTRHWWNNYYWTYNDSIWGEGPRYNGTRYQRTSREVSHDYDGPVYTYNSGWTTIHTVTALYGQDISDIWSFTGSNGKTYPQTDPVTSWQPSGSSTYTARITRMETMPDEDITFRHTTTDNRIRYFHYFVETADGKPGDIVFNGRNYELYTDLPNDFNIVYYNDDFWELNGFTRQAIRRANTNRTQFYEVNLSPGGTISWTTLNGYSGQDDHLYFFYTRNSYQILYRDGVCVDGNGNPIDESNLGVLGESSQEEYQADLSSYNKGGSDYFDPTRDGYVFEGWYIDSACTQPYTFTTMPEGGIQVYAKWRQLQYRVFLHPNTDDSTLDWGGDEVALTFRVPIGGTVVTPNGRRNGYELVGWYLDPDCRQMIDPESYILNETTVTTPYDKTTDFTDVMDKWGNGATWNSDVQDEDGNPRDRFWINKKLDLYAKWRAVLEGSEGIGVVYDANGGTNAPTDTTLYLDTAAATAQAASTAPAAAEGQPQQVFLYWVMQKWDEEQGKYVDIPDAPHVFPGDTFDVLKENAKMTVTEWEDEAHTIVKKATYTVQLRAEYGDAESHTPTHITWYANNGTGDSYTDEHLMINQAVPVENPGGIFVRKGYDFLGWARMTEVSDDSGNVITIGGAPPALLDIDLDEDDLFLKYENGKFYSTLNTSEGLSGPAPNTEIGQIAADERLDYHGMVAVWKPKTYTVTIKKVVDGSPEDMAETRKYEISYNYDETSGSVRLSHNASAEASDSVEYNTIFSAEELGEDLFDKTYEAKRTTDADRNQLLIPVTLEPEAGGGFKITGDTTITVTNTKKNKDIRILKVDDSTDPKPLKNVEFTINEETLKTGNDGYTRVITLDSREAYYLLDETGPDKNYDGLEQPVAVTVSSSGVSVPAGIENVSVTGPDADGVYTIKVINKLKTTPLTIVKESQFGDALEGAEFSISGEGIQDAEDLVSAIAEGGTDAVVTAFDAIPIGTYTLTETDVPDGYTKLEGPVVITVGANDAGDVTVSATINDKTDDSHIKIERDVNAEGKPYKLTVVNDAGAELPHTGGMGTTLFYILGAALTLICAAVRIKTCRS